MTMAVEEQAALRTQFAARHEDVPARGEQKRTTPRRGRGVAVLVTDGCLRLSEELNSWVGHWRRVAAALTFREVPGTYESVLT